MVAPYRNAFRRQSSTAPTRDGEAKLEASPGTITLEIPERSRLAIAGGFATLEQEKKRRFRKKTKKSKFRLGPSGLLAARAHLTHDIGLWIEERPGVVRRIFGLRRVEGLDQDAIDAWAQLDRLAATLEKALRGPGAALRSGLELGRGGHRVLLIERPNGMRLYARPVFRERPRLVAEVDGEGKLSLPRQKKYEPSEVARSRFSVVHASERLVFSNAEEREIGAVFLPWISEGDRDELAARFGTFVEGLGLAGGPQKLVDD